MMKIYTSRSSPNWAETDGSAVEGGDARAEADRSKAQLTSTLTSVLLSENLIVLAGLGTSLCVQDEASKKLAPTMDDLWAVLIDEIGEETIREVRRKVRYPENRAPNVEQFLSHCQLSQLLEADSQVAEFLAAAEAKITSRCRFASENTKVPVHEAFLRKCARRPSRYARLKLFTTNYDLCFEIAASKSRFVVIDGFSHAQPQIFDSSYFSLDIVRRPLGAEVPAYVPNVFHLYKLHGSVDWSFRDREITKDAAAVRPVLVYPRYGKFEASYDQPFIELMSRFQAELRQENVGILVIGSGLNDFHISQPILSAVRSNVSAQIVVVDPALESTGNKCIEELKDLARRGDTRLTLIAAGFEDLVVTLPDLVTASEEEQHLRRVQAMSAGSQ